MVNRPVFTLLNQDQFGFVELDATTTDHGRYYKTPDGKSYPSVTTVLGSIPNPSLDAWRKNIGDSESKRIMHHATTRGTAFHEAIERYCNNEEEYFAPGEMPHVKALFRSIEPALSRVGVIAAQEVPLYSDKYSLAGRVDMVADFDGIPSIVDFKTSARRKKHSEISNYFIQATAYALMFEERTGIPIDQIVILMAVDNDPEPLVFKDQKQHWIEELEKIVFIFSESEKNSLQPLKSGLD